MWCASTFENYLAKSSEFDMSVSIGTALRPELHRQRFYLYIVKPLDAK